jgi:hypothetical protein
MARKPLHTRRFFIFFTLLAVILFFPLIIFFWQRPLFPEVSERREDLKETSKESEIGPILPEPLGNEYYKDWEKFATENFEIYFPNDWTEVTDDVRQEEIDDNVPNTFMKNGLVLEIMTINDPEKQGIFSLQEYLAIQSSKNRKEDYGVTVKDQYFQHHLYEDLGGSLLKWFTQDDHGNIYLLEADWASSSAEAARMAPDREEILKIFSTFRLKNPIRWQD